MIHVNFGCMSRQDRATGSLLRRKDDKQPETIQRAIREFPFGPFSRIIIRQWAYMYQTENMVLIKNMAHLPWIVGKTRKREFHNYDPLTPDIVKILSEKKAEHRASSCFSVNVFLLCDRQSKQMCPGYALTRNLYRFSDRHIRNRIELEDLEDDDLVRSFEAADLYALRKVCLNLDSIPCMRCGVRADLDADEENTITCRGCASKAHLGCISLGKSRRESWYCPVCRVIAPVLTGTSSNFTVEVSTFELEQEPMNDLVVDDHNHVLSHEGATAIIVEDGLTPAPSPEGRPLDDEPASSTTEESATYTTTEEPATSTMTEEPRRRRNQKEQWNVEIDPRRPTTECSSSPQSKEKQRRTCSDKPMPSRRNARRTSSSKSSSNGRRLASEATDTSSSKSAEGNQDDHTTMNVESTSCSASSPYPFRSYCIVDDPHPQLSQQSTRKRVRQCKNNHVRHDVESDPAIISRMTSDDGLYNCEGPLTSFHEVNMCDVDHLMSTSGIPHSASSSSSAESTTGSNDDAPSLIGSLQFPELPGVEQWIGEELIKRSCVALEALITTEFLREDIHDEQHLREAVISVVRRFRFELTPSHSAASSSS